MFIKVDINSCINFYRLEPDAEPLFHSVELAFIWDYIAVGNFINEAISPKLDTDTTKEKYKFLPPHNKYRYESMVSFPIRRVFTESDKDLDVSNIAFLWFGWVCSLLFF